MGLIVFSFITGLIVWALAEHFQSQVKLPKFDIPIVNDDFFGELRCIQGYFHSLHFKINGEVILVRINIEADSPTQAQKDFFIRFEKKVSNIVQQHKQEIILYIQKTCEVLFDENDEIIIAGFLVPRSGNSKWEIVLEYSYLYLVMKMDEEQLMSIDSLS